MKAHVLRVYGERMALEEVPDPVPAAHEIVLKMTACGVCGTDLKITSGKLPASVIALPHTPGHEIAGEVVAVGRDVKTVKPGQHGLAYYYIGCRDCEMCRTGRENVCFSLKRLGFELPGGFAEYVKLPAYNFCTFEEGTPDAIMTVLSDAVGTPYHALKTLSGLSAGQDVLIVGIGGLGIHAVQLAKLMGARIIAVDKREEPLKLAREFGADVCINSATAGSQQSVREATRGLGVDVVIENVGSPVTLQWSLDSLKRRGTLIIVGYDPLTPFPLSTIAMHYNEWTIRGARACTKQELTQVVSLVQQGRIKPVVSRKLDWHLANDAIEGLRQGTNVGRTVLTF